MLGRVRWRLVLEGGRERWLGSNGGEGKGVVQGSTTAERLVDAGPTAWMKVSVKMPEVLA